MDQFNYCVDHIVSVFSLTQVIRIAIKPLISAYSPTRLFEVYVDRILSMADKEKTPTSFAVELLVVG
jgi:hypothetical protein